MTRIWLAALIVLGITLTAHAAGERYVMRVDGLACPYCAYGIEKKLNEIEGVKDIAIDLDNGLVTVDVADGIVLTEEQMQELFADAGFTYRSMKTESH